MSTKSIAVSEYQSQIQFWDQQHQIMQHLLERLTDTERGRGGHNCYLADLKELKLYMKFHFISEENMMARLNYPALEEHKASHRRLIEKIVNQEMRVEKSTDNRDEKLQQFIEAHHEHRREQDQAFIRFSQSLE